MREYPNMTFIKKCIKRWDITFDSVIDKSIFIYSDEIKLDLYDFIYYLIYINSVRTFIKEINLLKDEKNSYEYKEDLYKKIDAQFEIEENVARFFCKYPMLEVKLSRILENTKNQISFLFERLNEDRKILKSDFDFDIAKLNEINVGEDSDSHNHGARTFCLSDGKNKIIYKPHSLANDLFISDLFSVISPLLKLSLSHPYTIDKGEYGWQQYIMGHLPDNDDEWHRYYFRYGELLFIAYSLHMNDIHYENLIQKGEYPIIIDTETLVSYKNYSWLELSSAEEQSMQKIYFDFLSNTVLDTFMLPYKLEAITFDVDISPLSIYEEQKSNHMGGYKIVDEFSDDIRFEYQEFCTQAESVQHNPFCFLDDIVTGFEYTYNWFISNKKFYIQTVMELLSKYRVKVRQVLRATYVYAKFLDATTHPDYLVDETKLLQLLEKMIPKNKENYFRIWQGEMEVKSLLENDIPYFYTYIDENALYCDYGKIENYFDITIWDVITNKLSSLSEHDLERQKSMILLSMSMLGRTNLKKVNIAENSPSAVKYTTDYFSKKDIISEILRFITDKSIWNLEKICVFG